MYERKNGIIKHMALALILLLISSNDYIYRSLLTFVYQPSISLLISVLLISIFIVLIHKWYQLPYLHVVRKIDKYYKDMLKDTSNIKDHLLADTKINSLEDLLDLYKSAQRQQTELVCQLTNTNKVLDQNNRFANAIVQITSEILKSGDIHSILQLILNKAIEIIPNAQKGSILLYNKDLLEYKAMYGYDIEALKDFKFSVSEIYQYNAHNLYDPIIIPDVEKFNKNLKKDKFDVLKETRSFELKSCISCAISVDNEFYGIINIDNIDSNYAFIDEHKPIIKYFAEQIGVALKNAQLLEKILFMSQYDSLTKACNRSFFEEQLDLLHNESVKFKHVYSLVILDMNDLKLVNDSYGHEAGDELIVALTDYIQNYEQKPTLFGRIGGDEFALVYKDKTCQDVHRIMQSIRDHFNNVPFKHNNQEILNISFSYGVASYPNDGEDIIKLLKNADYLMYIDKRQAKEIYQ